MEEIYEQLSELKLAWSSSDLPISEKVSKLKSFVKTVQSLDPPPTPFELDDLLLTIPTSDFTSKRLRLELAHNFRRPDPLLDTLKMEEPFLVRRALTFTWLYEQGNSDLTEPDQLMKSVFPLVAFTTRLRILKQLGTCLKDESLAEQIWLQVSESYGSPAATLMLPACGPEFIREKLVDNFNSHRLHPSDQVLKRVALKEPEVALDYIKLLFCELRDKLYLEPQGHPASQGHHIKPYKPKVDLSSTLSFLWLQCPAQTWLLYETFDTEVLPKMSWQAAKKLFKTDRKLIVDAKKFSELIPDRKRAQVAPHMRSRFQSFFTALFPEEIEHFPEAIPGLFRWLEKLPRIKKFSLLNTSFRENYRCDILGVPDYISEEIMEVLPLGHREQVARMKLDAGDVTKFGSGDPNCEQSRCYMEAYWYSFMGIKKSIQKLKEILLGELEMKIRSDVAELLVYTCYINDRDVDSLVTVCRLITSRWIHGHYHIRERFLNAIQARFNFRRLNRDILWDALEEFVKLSRANREPPPKSLLEGLIEYNLRVEHPIDSWVNALVCQEYMDKYGPPDWEFLKHAPELHKRFLRAATDIICLKFPWEEAHVVHSDLEGNWSRLGIINLVEAFTRWNQRNRNLASTDRISVTEFPWLVCRLREIMMSDFNLISGPQVQLQQRIALALESDPEIRSGYFKEYVEVCPLAPVLEYFLRTDPREIRYHIQVIVPFMLKLPPGLFKTYRKFLLKVKTQGFPHFQAGIVESCLEMAQDDNVSWKERRNAILILSYLWDSKSYLNLVSLFYPEENEGTFLNSSVAQMDFRIRTGVINSLAQVSTSGQVAPDAFQCILRFCLMEDYVPAALGPLASLCFHAPLREALKFLKEDLLDRDVGIKLHAIKLVCRIHDRTEDYQELLAYLWENETHHRIKEEVLQAMFRLVGDRPTKENWGFLKGALNSLTAEDKELLQPFYGLKEVSQISGEFLPDYFLTCLEKFPEAGASLVETEFKAGTLEVAKRFVNYLPDEFLDHLVHHYLFEIKEPDLVQLRAIDLAVEYALKLNSDIGAKGDVLKGTFTKLNPEEKWNYTKNCKRMADLWVRAASQNMPSRQSLYQFVLELCDKSFRKLKVKGTPVLTQRGAKDTYRFVADLLDSHFNKQDAFTSWFYLRCARIFSPIQFHFANTEGKVRTKEVREEGFRLMTDAGVRFQKLVDDQIKSYGPFVLGFIVEKVKLFWEEVVWDPREEETLFEKERVIFFIDGLLKPYGENGLRTGISQANQILAIELMPRSAPQCLYYKRKYAECQDTLNKLGGRTTRIFLGDRYSTRF